MSIKATTIAQLAKSNRTITLTTEPGTVMVPSGADERPAAYDAGEVVICGHDAASTTTTTTIAGPLSRADAVALATAVLEGQPRAVTHPQLHLLLAGAVIAFTDLNPGGKPAVQERTAEPPVSPSPEPSPPDTERTGDDQS